MSPSDFALHEHGDGATQVRRTAAPLVVGAANDKAEVEADRIADQVIGRLESGDMDQHVHDGCHGVARSAAPAAGPAEVGYSGGELSDGLSTRINKARGSGRALDAGVRRRLEPAFGGSLADVRVHTGKEAAELNTAVSAKAFTTGKDIFFGAGEYSPDTAGGQRMLAHEIAHTRQGGGSAKRIHRLAFKNPKFSKTTKVTVFGEGGSGTAAEFEDGSGASLVVKVNQKIGNEVAIASKLHGGVSKNSKKSDGFKVETPDTRLATSKERVAIKQAALALVDPAKARSFLTELDSPEPVVIQRKSEGDSIKKIMKKGATKKGPDGKNVADEESLAFRMLNEPGPFRAIARHAPVDAFMGMFDRILGAYNPENFLYDAKTQKFAFVDNTHNIDTGFLVSNDKTTGATAFSMWAEHPASRAMSDPAALAQLMHKAVFDQFAGLHSDISGGGQMLFRRMATDNKDQILKWLEEGAAKGLAKLRSEVKKPMNLVKGVASDKKREALQSVIARGLILENPGMDADQAWAAGGARASKYIAPPPQQAKAPARPNASAPASPWQRGVKPSTLGSRTTGGGARMPALPATPGGGN